MRSETVVEEFKTQRVTVGTSPIRIGLEGTSKLYRGVWVKALSTNGNIVYMGMDNQAVTNGYELAAGESILIPIDLLEKVWAEAGAANQVICLLFA